MDKTCTFCDGDRARREQIAQNTLAESGLTRKQASSLPQAVAIAVAEEIRRRQDRVM